MFILLCFPQKAEEQKNQDNVINSCLFDYIPIHEASSDFSSITFSSTSWGKSMALNPKTVPILKEAIPETMHAAKYYF